jgi:hypothetical protein
MLVQFDISGAAKQSQWVSTLTILTGAPGKCVPVPAGSSQATGTQW